MKFLNAVFLALLLLNITVGQESSLENADGNSDGKVTTKEFKEYASQRLRGFPQLDSFVKKVDSNGNGEIDEKEFSGRMKVLEQLVSADQSQGAVNKAESGPHKVGDKATDFELQGVGKKIKLSENFGEDGNSTVVVFSRAHW